MKKHGAGREAWRCDAGAAEVALLSVPPHGQRVRVFDIDVRLDVRAAAAPNAASWFSLEVEIDGAREWSRRIDTEAPGEPDSLEHHCRREISPGGSVRVRAFARVRGAIRLRLRIDAEEAEPF